MKGSSELKSLLNVIKRLWKLEFAHLLISVRIL